MAAGTYPKSLVELRRTQPYKSSRSTFPNSADSFLTVFIGIYCCLASKPSKFFSIIRVTLLMLQRILYFRQINTVQATYRLRIFSIWICATRVLCLVHILKIFLQSNPLVIHL